MSVSLQDWLKKGWLVEHQTSRKEIADLLGMADRDLVQCQTPHLSADWQLGIAYNAALQAAIAALAAAVIVRQGRLITTGQYSPLLIPLKQMQG